MNFAELVFPYLDKLVAGPFGHAYDLEGYVMLPQDVKDIAPDILRHRVIPTYEAEAENLTSDDLIKRLLDELRTP